MLKHNEIYEMIADLPEADLEVLVRVVQGLKASHTTVAAPARAHVLPPPAAIRPAPVSNNPLANQYSQIMRREESPESPNLLRKVMFTPLSELLSWVNQPSESVSK